MPNTNHRDHCDTDDRHDDYSGLSKAARIEEYEDRRLTLGEEPDLDQFLVGLSDSERNDVLRDLMLSKFFLAIGRAYRAKRVSRVASSPLWRKTTGNDGR